MNFKSVRLDVLFEDDEAWYDIEMQVEDESNIPKRSRYYHASIDTHSLLKGSDYNELKPCYVIFICMFDLFGKNKDVYRFKMMEESLYLPLNESRYTIILNTKCSSDISSKELKAFFDYLNKDEVTKGEYLFIDEIHRDVMKHNTGKELMALMTLEEELKIIYERAKKEAVLETAKKMKEKGCETDFILEITGLSKEEVEAL